MKARVLLSLGLAALGLGVARPARAAVIYSTIDGLTLIRYSSSNPGAVTVVGDFSGATGFVAGLDFRPANGLLYGFDSGGPQIVTIDPNTAVTTFVSNPSPAADPLYPGIDFNPVPDRLRVVATNNQNLRINVDTGATIEDGTLEYAAGDPNFGVDPSVNEVAYTNSFGPSPRTPPPGTQLYYIDFGLDILATTSNPNAGILNTVGPLGVDAQLPTGFDILSDSSTGTNVAFASLTVDGQAGLYRIDLATGAATFVGDIGVTPTFGLFGLAAQPLSVPEPASLALLGLGAVGAAVGRRLRRKA
ncbi:MAG: DUF4394 domain-containing protein [Gemmataceae bacterium]|nr:DUF4394 domain-containing protein [Gemmataceae bacterium]